MNLSKLGLLFVIFVDLCGQGLILPIVNTLVMQPGTGFLPAGTSDQMRHFSFGLIIGVFYLSWFLGAVYISKLSDSIGRKAGMLICLAGALAGYVLTILSVIFGSLWMMVLGRAITGFTSGNQPIAQAAMADLSKDDAEMTRNMGYCVGALSVGLVVGPLLAGVLSDSAILGSLASLNLPFYVAIVLVLVSMSLIILFFEDKLTTRTPLQIKPLEVVLLLWKVRRQPTVLRVSAVFFFFMLIWNTCYVFIDTFLLDRFHVGTLGASIALFVFGGSLVFTSTVLVGPLTARVEKRLIVTGAAALQILALIVVLIAPDATIAYVALVPLAAGFAMGFPTLLSLFSASVGESEQGWVMGVATALWTLGAGLIALIGGDLLNFGARVPLLVAIGAAVVSLILAALFWRSPDVRRIAKKDSAPDKS